VTAGSTRSDRGEVVEPDQRDRVLKRGESQPPDYADCDQVLGGEDRGRRISLAQELAQRAGGCVGLSDVVPN
jgi:hypothetical protein